jgi:hypothetical protein
MSFWYVTLCILKELTASILELKTAFVVECVCHDCYMIQAGSTCDKWFVLFEMFNPLKMVMLLF